VRLHRNLHVTTCSAHYDCMTWHPARDHETRVGHSLCRAAEHQREDASASGAPSRQYGL
jgi:hypothetical protein